MLIRKMKTKNQDKRITTYVLITTLQLKNTLRHNLPRLNVYIVLQFEKKKNTEVDKKVCFLTNRKRTVIHKCSCCPRLFACKFQKKHWEHLEITLPMSGDEELTILWESAMEIHYYCFLFKKWGTNIFFKKKPFKIRAHSKSLEIKGIQKIIPILNSGILKFHWS